MSKLAKRIRRLGELSEAIKMGKRLPYAKLESGERQRANEALRKAGLDGNGRFRSAGHALTVAMEALGKLGFEQDDIPDGRRLKQDQGNMQVHLAKSNLADVFSPVSVSNSVLAFQWYKHREGIWEALAYLS